MLGSTQFPAPAAQTWKAVAEVLSRGLNHLESVKIWCIVIGGLVGIILPLLAKALPKYEKWIPSAAGVGLAWTFQWYTSLLFFMGAVIGYGFEKASPKKSEEFTFPVASGLIAGGSLMAVVLIFWRTARKCSSNCFRDSSTTDGCLFLRTTPGLPKNAFSRLATISKIVYK